MYYKGDGVAEDCVLAYKWMSLSAASGQENATKVRDQIEQGMTPEQVTEAKALVAAFKPRKETEAPASDESEGIAPAPAGRYTPEGM